MRRALRTITVVLSPLLCTGAAALRFRSPRYLDHASVITSSRHYVLITYPGGIQVATWSDPAEPARGLRVATYPYYERNEFGAAAEPLRVDWGRFGFDVGGVHFSNEPAPRIDSWEVSVPFWFFALAGLVAPVFAFARWMRRRRRMTAGCCVRCGYDLRASRDRCPECGATIPQRPSAAPVPSLT